MQIATGTTKKFQFYLNFTTLVHDGITVILYRYLIYENQHGLSVHDWIIPSKNSIFPNFMLTL